MLKTFARDGIEPTSSRIWHVAHGVSPSDPEVRGDGGLLLDMLNGDFEVPLGVESRICHSSHKKVGPSTRNAEDQVVNQIYFVVGFYSKLMGGVLESSKQTNAEVLESRAYAVSFSLPHRRAKFC